MAETNPSSVNGNAPVILLAVFASIFLLDWAQAVFIPLVLGLIVSYALAPVVDRLERFRIPRGLSAAVLLLAFVGGVGATVFSLRDEAVSLVETLPAAVQKMQESVRKEFAGQGKTITEGGGGGPGDRARHRRMPLPPRRRPASRACRSKNPSSMSGNIS